MSEAATMITAQVELLADILDELKPMFPLHHKELGLFQDRMPLDPDYAQYLSGEAAGQILTVTLRENGAVVGYWISHIRPHLHYKSTLTNAMDILYVHPDHRGNASGLKLAALVKAESIRRGVKVWYAGSKNHKEIEWFFDALGFERAESYHVMWLGEK